MAGRLEVITGPMFSGKTEELIRRIRRETIAGRSTIVLKPNVDTRYSLNHVASHNGSTLDAVQVDTVAHPGEDYDVVGVDEVQFFDALVVRDIEWLVNGLNKKVVVAGLDMTYRREPFGVIPHLMAIADRVQKLSAVCHVCGNDAPYTQRLVNGKPASFAGETIIVGGLETYEARCRQCFETG